MKGKAVQNDVLFSIFDPQKGPIILYSTISSQEIAKKIVMKSYVAIGAMEGKIDLESKYALLPLPSFDKIAFYYMFKIQSQDDRSQKLYATITFAQNSSATMSFYRSLPEIQKKVLDSVTHLQDCFIYTKDAITLDNKAKNILESLLTMEAPGTGTFTHSIPAETIIFDDPNSGSLNFLLEYFQDGLEKVIFSLLMEEPILILGTVRDIVDKVVKSMELLVPHRVLKKEYLLSFVDPKNKDLLICSPQVNFLKNYKNITIVDVQSSKITKKSRDLPSIGNLIQTLKIAPIETQKTVIHNYIDNLLAKTAQLLELCEKEQISQEEIQAYRSELQGDELYVVISMVKRYAPQFEIKLFHFARSLF
ncbi:MAG: hypothetical protein EAX86_06865 [Candidatus Heimdallarchaeota archaeon]|nr:hypothetical protein [Candidatus Heimdallarchaeota archaeon]